MRTALALTSVTAFIGSACAVVDIAHPILQRDVNALLPRATGVTDAVSSKCQSALSEILSSVPTPPPQLVSAETKEASSMTNPCSYQPPSSISKEYSSYTSEVLSWYSKHSKEVDAAFKVCTELKSLATGLVHICSTDSGVPTALLAAATSTGSDHSTGTETSKHSTETGKHSTETGKHSTETGSTAAASGSSSSSTGAAPRETGMALAAIAAGLVAAAL
ncbi:hypothetical protein CC79DRAFT_1326726 [Sarocladium strictum]